MLRGLCVLKNLGSRIVYLPRVPQKPSAVTGYRSQRLRADIPVIHRRSALFIAYIQSVITAEITRSHEINSIRPDGGKERIFTRHPPRSAAIESPVQEHVRIRIALSVLHNSTCIVGKHNNLKPKVFMVQNKFHTIYEIGHEFVVGIRSLLAFPDKFFQQNFFQLRNLRSTVLISGRYRSL